MTRKCCVVGCTSGYDTNKEKVNSFVFPRDEAIKSKWLEAIGRKGFKSTKWSTICHKHFQEDDIVRHCVGIDRETGAETLFPSRVKLREGAVPLAELCVFTAPKIKKVPEDVKKTTRRGRPRKASKPISRDSSSDEDIPLETLKKKCTKDDGLSPEQTLSNFDSDVPLIPAENKTLNQRFHTLLDQYEKLKDKHVALGQAIDVLEKINTELKCKIFKF